MFNTEKLLPPQGPHSEYLADALQNKGIAVDLSPTGTGKTFVGAAIARQHNLKVGVLCPKLNIPKWDKVLKDFGVKPEFILNYEKLARGNTPYYRYKKRGMKDTPFPLRGEFHLKGDVTLLLDESHRCKGLNSLQSGIPFAAKNQGIPMMFISATQAMTPLDMRSFGYATNLHKGMSFEGGRHKNYGMNAFKDWCVSAGAEFVGHWGAMFFDSEKQESRQKLQMVHDNLFHVQKIASRMNRADFGNLFRKNQIEADPYDMGENGRKIARIYDDMQQELYRLEESSKDYSQHIFAIIIKARRRAELLKVPAMVEMVQDQIEEGRSVIIFVNFQDTIDSLNARLSEMYGQDKVGMIHGQITPKQREENRLLFQSDKIRILICNICAGGESIDLQDITGRYPRTQLVNPSFRSISVLQSIGRADRAMAMSDIITRMVIANGTIEDSVANRFDMKKDHLDLLNDGDLIPDGISFNVGRIIAGQDM